jgi:hypothetical protein
MSREMEYYEQFGALSCSDPGDRPSISDADESGFSDVGENPGASEAGDKPGSSDVEEEAEAAGG